ncbi:hypothetical protein [Luteolibacter soli]|uniref:EF-hand domain-containing protein n=1 Tax=Luteolibacter soli TaxID=3135280 RepID=A0ABU9B3K8_9BACT
MKTPSSSALIGSALLIAAGLFLAFHRHDPASGTDDSPVPLEQPRPGLHARSPIPGGPGSTVAKASEPALILTDDGLADFANYDRDGDGDPEVDAFLNVYRRVDSSAAKVDLLENVRTFDTSDDPQLNDLLIYQAAKAEDSKVRTAARAALFEHGGAKAHDSLAAYLKSETRAADRQELEKLLDDLQRTPLSLVRSGSKKNGTPPSPP